MLVTGGSTDVTTYFQMRLTAGGDATGLTMTDFDMSYTRSGAATAAKVDATALAAAESAHADNKGIEVDATDCPGLYRFDWPDAAFVAGVQEVILTIKHASCFTESLRVEIDGKVNTVTVSDKTGYALTAAYDAAKTAAQVGNQMDLVNAPNATAVTAIQNGLATSAEVTSIQNNTRCVRVVNSVIERPDSGTQTYRIELLLYDAVGNMEAPDSAPTIELVNQAGTDLSARLDATTMSLVSTGRYRAIYTATDTDDLEQLVWTFSVVEGGNTRAYGNTSVIVDTTAVDFTAADRTVLQAAATAAALATAQSDLDALTGADGAILATSQPNYAPNTTTPPTVAQIRAEMDSNSTQLALLAKIMQADPVVDITDPAQYKLKLYERGTYGSTNVLLLTWNLKSVAGLPIVNTTTIVGQQVAP